LTTLGLSIKIIADKLLFPDWYRSAVTAFFTISLCVNALATALIVYKIITVYNDIRGLNISNVQTSAYGNGHRDLYPLISILIESGLMTLVAQLTQSIMYKAADAAFTLALIAGSVVDLVF
jgi:hypothetical protein